MEFSLLEAENMNKFLKKSASLALAVVLLTTGCAGNTVKEGESGSLSESSVSGNLPGSSDRQSSGEYSAGGSPVGGESTYSSESSPASAESSSESYSGVESTESSSYSDNTQSSSSSISSSSSSSTSSVISGGISCEVKTGNTWEEGGNKCGSAEVIVKNNSGSAVGSWKVSFTVPNGFKITNSWGGNFSVNGSTVTVTNVDYNGNIPAGGSVSGGFNYSSSSALNSMGGSGSGSASSSSSSAQSSNPVQSSSGGYNPPAPTGEVKDLLKRSDKAVQGDDWLHTDGNKILDKNGKQVWLTGVNWFGYNTGTNTFDGLWNSQLVPSVKAIADHGFNLIRVPISVQLINQWAAGEYPRANYNNAYNPELNDMNSLEIFEYFLKLAEENGLKVMPDIHCAETDAMGHNVNLWYTDKVSVNDYYRALEWLASRYKNNDTIIAIDIKNEPHGKQNEQNKAIWNNSTDINNWKYTAETAAKKILAINPNVLIMVEGTEIYPKSKSNSDYKSQNADDYYFNWWGGNLRGVRDYPINLGSYQNKLVYSPHDYGPTVYQQPWFKNGYNYESLMRDCWNDNWLYIHKENIAPLLIGEWGGFMREPNLTWMTCMRKLIKNYHLNHTFWCYNANSGDTGGLVLDDFKTWDTEKYNFVREVLWQESGKFVGLDHAIPLGENGITLSSAKGL